MNCLTFHKIKFHHGGCDMYRRHLMSRCIIDVYWFNFAYKYTGIIIIRGDHINLNFINHLRYDEIVNGFGSFVL